MAARQALAGVLRAESYDVVVCHAAWPHALFAPVAREQGAKLVHYTHDVPNRRGWLDHLATRTRPDLVVCNCHFTEESGRWLFPRVRRTMLRYPLAFDDQVDRSARSRVRAQLGAADDAVVIIHASRMQAWKGHSLLVEALAKLAYLPRWICWFAGGAQRPEEQEYVRRLRDSIDRHRLSGRFRFLGQRMEDLRRIANEAGLVEVEIRYTDHGRIPLTSQAWPRVLGAGGRAFSDNVIMVARRP